MTKLIKLSDSYRDILLKLKSCPAFQTFPEYLNIVNSRDDDLLTIVSDCFGNFLVLNKEFIVSDKILGILNYISSFNDSNSVDVLEYSIFPKISGCFNVGSVRFNLNFVERYEAWLRTVD